MRCKLCKPQFTVRGISGSIFDHHLLWWTTDIIARWRDVVWEDVTNITIVLVASPINPFAVSLGAVNVVALNTDLQMEISHHEPTDRQTMVQRRFAYGFEEWGVYRVVGWPTNVIIIAGEGGLINYSHSVLAFLPSNEQMRGQTNFQLFLSLLFLCCVESFFGLF